MNDRFRWKKMAILLWAGWLTGCSFIPDYHRPDQWKATSFKEDGIWRYAHPADTESKGDWWTYYHDATLDKLENQVISGNFQLQAALQRYQEATAFLTEQSAYLYPQINLIGGVTSNGQSSQRLYRSPVTPRVQGDMIGGVGTLYEIDFWGAIRSAIASAKAGAEASQAQVAYAELSLQALLASSYVKLRGLDAEVKLLEDTVKDYQHELDLMQQRHDVGINSDLDVQRSRSLLEETKAQEAKIIGQRALYEHAVAVLVGEEPSRFPWYQIHNGYIRLNMVRFRLLFHR